MENQALKDEARREIRREISITGGIAKWSKYEKGSFEYDSQWAKASFTHKMKHKTYDEAVVWLVSRFGAEKAQKLLIRWGYSE